MRYPIGIQSFAKIIEGGYVYVDKTDLVYDLAQENVLFLCRPRRFGKSLLVSTLEAYFKGRKELFEGLKIASLEQEWAEYPVFKVDFVNGNFSKSDSLTSMLEGMVAHWEKLYGKAPNQSELGMRFLYVLHAAHEQTGRRVVVLVDEYDKPLLDVIGEAVEQENRNVLREFYSTFKAADDDLRFVLLTGVTKFSQVSVFSGFNQPNDISMDPHYEALCGITGEELHTIFAEPIKTMAAEYGNSEEEMRHTLKHQYDGYHFSRNMTDIYNPFSIINAFNKNYVDDYWYSTGTPTFLAKLISGHNINMERLLKRWYPASKFVDYRADVSDPLAMLYQSGYLTIKGYDPEGSSYRLDYPNAEVRRGFSSLVANEYYGKDVELTSWALEVNRYLYKGCVEDLMESFASFFADIDYRAEQRLKAASYEEHFHYTFYLIMKMLSCYRPLTEKSNSRGRCDMVVETPEYVYLFEFKLNGSAEEALAQIAAKGYAEPYGSDPRQIVRIGVAFSEALQNISEWKTA